MTHTPGPWMIDDSHGITIVSNDWVIGRVTYGCTAKQKNTAFANARLIAAAPEMLEALIAIDVTGKDANPNADVIIASEIWDLVQQSIAKAKGEIR